MRASSQAVLFSMTVTCAVIFIIITVCRMRHTERVMDAPQRRQTSNSGMEYIHSTNQTLYTTSLILTYKNPLSPLKAYKNTFPQDRIN